MPRLLRFVSTTYQFQLSKMRSVHHGDFPTPQDLKKPLIPPQENKRHSIEKLCIDDMLRKYCGEFGRWQLRHFVLTSLAWALEAFHTMVMIFADQETAWRCLEGKGEECMAAKATRTGLCNLDAGSWDWIGGKSSSTVAEWDLFCGEKYKIGLVQALFFGGCMIGAGVFGHLSDSYLGRKGSLTVVCSLNAIFGCLTALSPNYYIYTLLRSLTGFSTGGVGLCAFVLATEPAGPSKRGVAGMSTFYFFAGGITLLSGIAYAFRSWRALYIVSSVPSLLFVIFVIPFLSESPRWYVVRGRVSEAMNVMRKIAKSNGNFLPEEAVLVLDDDYGENDDGNGNFEKNGTVREAARGSLFDVLRSPITRIRLILAFAINFLCSIVYYGLSLNVVNLGTNIYLTVFLNSITEMPAFPLTAMMLDRFGRKPLLIGTLWFSGGFCFLGFFMGGIGGWKIARMICSVMGIFGMAGTYNLLFIYTTELFPTVVRNAALGCATQAAQMGAILAPFVVVLGYKLPFIVFAVSGIVGGLLAFLLPETLNQPMYDTMAGLEEGEAALVGS